MKKKKLFVKCYQKVQGCPKPPFEAQLMEEVPMTGRCSIIVKGHEFRVLRGACSEHPVER